MKTFYRTATAFCFFLTVMFTVIGTAVAKEPFDEFVEDAVILWK